MNVTVKRIYDTPKHSDGYRVLVDRLWPRGMKKDDAQLDEWTRDLAPSDALRKWFGHDPDRWNEFRKRYSRELGGKKEEIIAMVRRSQNRTVTLLFAAKDLQRNNAVVLKEYIEKHMTD